MMNSLMIKIKKNLDLQCLPVVIDPLIIIIFILMMSSLPPTQSVSNYAVAKPDCVDRCGEVSIPYPFGTSQDCYQSRSFLVECNKTFSPPKLYWGNSTIEITNISLDGQLTVLQYIARDCYAPNATRISHNKPWITLPTYFTVNNTANKFTIVGCDTYAYVSGWWLNQSYTTGCMAFCNAKDDLVEGSCMGLGCCQLTYIPQDVWTVEIDLRSFSNYTNRSGFDNCSYAFLAQETAFTVSQQSIANLKNVTHLPMVADWAIGNMTCEEAKKNSSAYACKSLNSMCYKPDNGYGYRCSCLEGYQGNPYLVGGCQDIDECKLGKCRYDCQNTNGNYTCLCPKGYHGDGQTCSPRDSGESLILKLVADIDECKLGKCRYDCQNSNGNYTCLCPKGYHGDGQTCSPRDSGESFILKLVAGIALAIILLLLVAFLLYWEHKRRSFNKMKQKFFLQNGGTLLQEKLHARGRSPESVKIFTSFELKKATNDFSNSMIVGQGGFGTVYKGLLPDNSIVAIKKSKYVDPNQVEQFINEVIVLSQVNHRNVVRLIGCCLETEVPLLVYEFISNGTLSSHIHNQARAPFLSWDIRLKIAAEAAGVLSYLHSAAATPIIHRDVKSDNILLDHSFTAKVSDFGASRLVPLDHTQLSTVVQGTLGYLDPEYMQTNQLTEKSDVYSFGVVLLELLTGRRAIIFDKPEDEKNLANFFLSVFKQERLLQVVDDNILGDDRNIREQILEVARLAQGCLNVKGEDRPSMKEVAMELEGLRHGGKHSWAQTEGKAEEMESLLAGGYNGISIDGYGDGTSVGFDSLRSHVDLRMSGGR
ncbi:UNVERIFIED_CONTAM: Wall-associated receptor kinase [Sesamum radiatum]|uniref:Wall-associated receptor kinase n=1 Tax=Sesamum radiatum TaxID=300843 RepID=A0AAW2PWY3_SESRA